MVRRTETQNDCHNKRVLDTYPVVCGRQAPKALVPNVSGTVATLDQEDDLPDLLGAYYWFQACAGAFLNQAPHPWHGLASVDLVSLRDCSEDDMALKQRVPRGCILPALMAPICHHRHHVGSSDEETMPSW